MLTPSSLDTSQILSDSLAEQATTVHSEVQTGNAPTNPFYVDLAGERSSLDSTRFAVLPDSAIPDEMDQAPAVRLASMSWTTSFSR